MMDMSGMYLLLGALFLAGAAVFALYFVQAFAVYRMAKRLGFSYPILAWIPYAQSYLLGRLCDRSCAFRIGKDRYFRVILVLAAVVSPSVVGILLLEFLHLPIPSEVFLNMSLYGLGTFFRFAAALVNAYALYYLYADYAPGQEGAYTALSVVLASFAPPVLLFLLRERLPLSAGGTPPVIRPQGPGTTNTGQYQFRQSPPPPPSLPPRTPRPRQYNDPKGLNTKK